jgi:SAM-dependent methyltransferase
VAALYDRLGRLPGAERLAEIPLDRWSPPFVQVIREQVLETLEERRLAASLPRLTPIDDAVSQSVQAMYEENPYPRWRAVRYRGVEPLIKRFRALCPGEPEPDWPSPVPVLVAGAGSGQHPIQAAMRMPEASVLGIDLSRTSLGYGARMAAQIGVPNLRLAQADILALDVLDERFALIECAGVLHHLADPMAGWAVLRRLLRPDGLMQISLYSELARASVVAARELVAALAIPSTPDGIRAARREIVDLPSNHPTNRLTRYWDFYSQSGFRDLVMHVQEHRFAVPQLAAALDALDLRFLGFDVRPVVRDAFRALFPQPEAWFDLDAWDQFEHQYPTTFATMYHLWCRPR